MIEPYDTPRPVVRKTCGTETRGRIIVFVVLVAAGVLAALLL